jgi:dipeptidyl aminopeptidase/acylaminoacyl peptidase
MKFASLITAAAVVALLSPAPPTRKLPRDPAERARAIAQILEANARQLTLFDRQGQSVGVVGRGTCIQQPVLSPDGKRLAVIKADLDKETNDLWVIDVATRARHADHHQQDAGGRECPAWSPDSNQVAVCGAARRLLRRLPQRARAAGAGGAAAQELGAADAHRLVAGRPLPQLLLHRPGGRGAVRAAHRGDGERKPIEVLRSKFQLQGRGSRPTAG